MTDENIHIESPLHQLKVIEEAVKETGTSILIIMGVDEFAKEFQNLDGPEIVAKVTALRLLPSIMMNGETEGGPAIVPVFAFVDQAIADELETVVVDEKADISEE